MGSPVFKGFAQPLRAQPATLPSQLRRDTSPYTGEASGAPDSLAPLSKGSWRAAPEGSFLRNRQPLRLGCAETPPLTQGRLQVRRIPWLPFLRGAGVQRLRGLSCATGNPSVSAAPRHLPLHRGGFRCAVEVFAPLPKRSLRISCRSLLFSSNSAILLEQAYKMEGFNDGTEIQDARDLLPANQCRH